VLVASILLATASDVASQTGGHTLFGDFTVDESRATGLKPINFDLILVTSGGTIMGRQTITNNSRYRFMDVQNGEYDIVVEVETTEVARVHILLNEIKPTDIRHDISLEWHESPFANKHKSGTVSAADSYKRSPKNKKRFEKAQEDIDKGRYDEAVARLRDILADDHNDYQCWTELGTVYLIQKNASEAETAYVRAVEIRPDYLLALLNLGRLRLLTKKFDAAIEILSKAVTVNPTSADANFYLGEAYLRIKKGSKAVGYLNEALKLDPVGKADAHLRLAALYNAVGLKDKAVFEYEQFLKVKPDYPERKKLEQYIAVNKAQAKKP